MKKKSMSLSRKRSNKVRKGGRLKTGGVCPSSIHQPDNPELLGGERIRDKSFTDPYLKRPLRPYVKRHFFERLSVTLQRENGALLLERSPLLCSAANVNGDL